MRQVNRIVKDRVSGAKTVPRQNKTVEILIDLNIIIEMKRYMKV